MSPAITDWKKQLITVVVFLFPALCVSVEHAGSTIFGILVLLGLVYGWQGWDKLDKDQKQFFISLLVLFVVIAVGLFYTADVKEGASKLERYLRILLVIPVYLMFRRLDIKSGKIFTIGLVIATVVMVTQGWYQAIYQGRSYATGAYHKIVFGDVAILFSAFLLLATICFSKNATHYLWGGMLTITGFYVVILSDSRSALLFMPLAIILVLFLYRKNISLKIWKILGSCFLTLLLLMYFIQPDKIINTFKRGADDFAQYQNDPSEFSSWGARLNFWQNSLTMFSESPIIGKGTGSYQAENKVLVENGISNASYVTDFGHAHSIYFHILAENGLVGIVAMVIALIILPFRYFYRRWLIAQDPEQYFYPMAGLVSVLAFAWFGVSEMWLARNPFVNVYFMCMLVFMSSTANVFSENNIEKNKA